MNAPRRTANLITKTITGFSLIELLVVMGIIAMILAFTLPAVVGISRGNNMSAAGRAMSNLLTIARSEAINRRTLVRFEIATTWPLNPTYAYRKFTLVQHDVETGTDTQLTSWETLPTGAIFQNQDPLGGNATAADGKYFFTLKQAQNPSLKIAGQDVSTTYIEFTPTGALNVNLADSPVRLRVDQGVYDPVNSAIALTGTSNWYEASIDGLVGRIRLSRP